MAEKKDTSKCRQCCKLHFNCPVIFRVVCLLVLLVGIIFQARAISKDTVWDEYETTFKASGLMLPNGTTLQVPQGTKVSAHQTLYDVVVRNDITNVGFIPPVYPSKPNFFANEWKSTVLNFQKGAMVMAAVGALITENAILVHFLSPSGICSKIIQPIMFVLTIVASGLAGIFAVVGAAKYKDKFRTILNFNNVDKLPSNWQNQIRTLHTAGFSYNVDDNVLVDGYIMALIGGALFLFTCALQIINLVVYLTWRRDFNKTKVTKTTVIEHVEK